MPPKMIPNMENNIPSTPAKEHAFEEANIIEEQPVEEQPTEKNEPTPEEAPQKKRLKKSIAIVDVGSKVEDVALDRGAYEMTEEAKKLAGFRGGLLKLWKHQIVRESTHFNRQRKAKKNILAEGNIFANETDEEGKVLTAELKAQKQAEFSQAITERFLSENKDLVEEEIGEKVVKNEDARVENELKDLINDFAKGNYSEEAFLAEKNRIIAEVRNNNSEIMGDKMQVDNILEVAKEIRDLAGHQAGLEAIEFDIELTLGKAQGGIKTKAEYDSVESRIKKITSNRLGALLLNETSIGAAVTASIILMGKKLSQSAAAMTAKWVTFGAGVALTGAFAYKKEGMRTEHDRETHLRELATKGGDLKEIIKEEKPVEPVKPESFANEEEKAKYKEERRAYRKEKSKWDGNYKRRLEMEPARYTTAKAEDLINSLHSYYGEDGNLKTLDKDTFNTAISDLSAAISRNKLANANKIDLISYSSQTSVETERTELLKSISRLKVGLKRFLQEQDGSNHDLPKVDELESLINTTSNVSEDELHKDVTDKDQAFSKVKSKRSKNAAAWAVAVGATVGLIVQEIAASDMFDAGNKVQNVFEAAKTGFSNHFTALGALRHFLEGQFGHPNLQLHDVVLGHNTFKLPDGAEIVAGKVKGIFNLMSGHNLIAELGLRSDGTLNEASVKALHEAGVSVHQVAETIVKHTTEKTNGAGLMNFWAQNLDKFQMNGEHVQDIHRLFWDENNTPKFDLNELRGWLLLDKNDNYVLDLTHMFKEGSFHGTHTANVPQEILNGKMHILLSLTRELQHRVIDLPIDRTTGTVTVDKMSEVGKTLFAIVNGQPESLSKFLEAAIDKGPATDGHELYEVVATAIGKGVDEGTIPKDVAETFYKTMFSGNTSYDVPYFIPVTARRPLERLRDLFRKNKKTENANFTPQTPEPEIREQAFDAEILSHGEKKAAGQNIGDHAEDAVILSEEAQGGNLLEQRQEQKGLAAHEENDSEGIPSPEMPADINAKIDQIDSDYSKYYAELQEREEEIKKIGWDKEKIARFEKAKEEIQGKMMNLIVRRENILDSLEISEQSKEEEALWEELSEETEAARMVGQENAQNFLEIKEIIDKRLAELAQKKDQLQGRMIDRSESEDTFFEALNLMGTVEEDGQRYDSAYFQNIYNNPGDLDLNKLPKKNGLRDKFKKFWVVKWPKFTIFS